MRREAPENGLVARYSGRAVERMQPEELYETTGDGRVLTVLQPLRNRAECQACHGEDHKTRGIVRVSLSLEKLDAEISAERNRRIIMAILTIGILESLPGAVPGEGRVGPGCPGRGCSPPYWEWGF